MFRLFHGPILDIFLDSLERLWRSVKYEEVYLKAYHNGAEARLGIGAYLDFYNRERPHQALGYRTPGQVFEEGVPERSLHAHAQSLSSSEVVPDNPAVDSLNLLIFRYLAIEIVK